MTRRQIIGIPDRILAEIDRDTGYQLLLDWLDEHPDVQASWYKVAWHSNRDIYRAFNTEITHKKLLQLTIDVAKNTTTDQKQAAIIFAGVNARDIIRNKHD